MQFTAKEDIEAPAEAVFAAVTDFDAVETLALRRGIRMVRTDRLENPGAGMTWQVDFRYRGKPRSMAAELRRWDPPQDLHIASASTNFAITIDVAVVALSRRRSRLVASMEIRPRTLPARLLIQTARLGKSNLSRRFAERLRGYASDLESRLSQAW